MPDTQNKLQIQRLTEGFQISATSTGERKHRMYATWDEFNSAFGHFMSDAESERLHSRVENAICAVDVFEREGPDRRFTDDFLKSLGFE